MACSGATSVPALYLCLSGLEHHRHSHRDRWDTLAIRGIKFRFHGVDAPESFQTCQDARGKTYLCGQKAALALSDKIASRSVTCLEKDKDRYGHIVAVCSVAGLDLNRWLVGQGLARRLTRVQPGLRG